MLWLSMTLHLVFTVLLGIDVWSAEPLTMDSFLRAPLQSVELVFGKVAVGRGHTQDRSIGDPLRRVSFNLRADLACGAGGWERASIA